MRFTPLWTTITPHSVGGREVLLLQNAETGQGSIATFDDEGQVAVVVTEYVGPGWSDVLSTNGFLLFYDYRTGRGAINEIFYDEELKQFFRGGSPDALEFSAGWTSLISDGRGILFYNYATQTAATGAVITLRPPNTVIPRFVYRQDKSLLLDAYPRFSLVARCRNQVVLYAYDDAHGQYFSVSLGSAGEFRDTWGNPSGPDYLPPYTHAVGMHDRLFFYDALGGDGEVGRLTQEGQYIRLKTLRFSPWWTHVVGNDYRVLFYRASTGEAVTGYFDAGGDFVQQQAYL